jgi:hypothetical protein
LVFLAACDSSSSNETMDLSMTTKDMSMPTGDLSTPPSGDMTAEPTLTVNNTLDWCTVTVTIGAGAPTMFSGASQQFMAAAGTTVTLHAVPNPGFKPVKWTGTTTMNGADATYVMTSADMQSVTACCALSDGSGC